MPPTLCILLEIKQKVVLLLTINSQWNVQLMQPENSAPDQQSHQRQPRRLDNADLIKSSFWISQIFMVIATVAGVFLAAQEGLSQALLFENLNSKEKNFYLQHALSDELSDNITTLSEYATLLKENTPYDIKAHHPMVDMFVWNNMKYSSNALETPSQILSAVRRYNTKTATLIHQIESRQLGAKHGAKLLEELNTKVRDGALKALVANYSKLHQELTEAGMDVNPL